MSRSSRLRGQDGFIRELVWIAVILAVLAVVILDGMAIFNAYQSAGDDSVNAADAAHTEYVQTTDVNAARTAADEYLAKKGLAFVDFSAVKTSAGNVRFTVTAEADTATYAFHYLGLVPPLEEWVDRTLHPVRSGSVE